MTGDFRSEPINLAREQPFALHTLEVRPARREVKIGGVSEMLEPRVAQVLVALARSRGDVVSRDELIASCWDGRIVTDDAINRCIGRVRRLGEASNAFSIETIPRVGYRLVLRDLAGLEEAPGEDLHGISDRRLIVVLPFDNLSDDPDVTYFSDGLAEEVIQVLTRRVNLRVIGRTSSFQYRGADKAIAKVAAELQVSHVLDGAVRKFGDRLRVTAQLIDAHTHLPIWSEQFDRRLGDLLALQEEIAQRVAESLNRRLAPATRRPALDGDAFDLYLRARDQMLNLVTSRSTVRLLDEVTSRAPDFAPGWAAAANARQWLRQGSSNDFSPVSDAEAKRLFDEAQAAVRRALQLAPNDPSVVAASVALEPVLPEWRGLEERLLAASQAAPQDLQLLFERANLLNHVGRYREAVVLREELHRRDPLHAIYVNHLALALETVGRAGEAMQLYEEAARRWPSSPLVYLNFANRCARRGDWATVDRLLAPEKLAVFPKDAPLVKAMLATTAALRMPPRERVNAISERMRAAFEQGGRLPFSLIRTAADLGDLDELFDYVARSDFDHLKDSATRTQPADVGGVFLLFAWPAPRFRGDVRFVHLCARLGLVAYWVETGRWPDCAEEVAGLLDFRSECLAALRATARLTAAGAGGPGGPPPQG